jgi:peroxiredoxin
MDIDKDSQKGSSGSFLLVGTDGVPRSLSEPTGRPLLVAFFKTTCPACKMAFGYLERLNQAYGSQRNGRGLEVWGVSQDALDESLAFAVEQGITFPVLLDTGWDASLAYGIETVPTMYLRNGSGDVLFTGVGFAKADLNEMSRLVAGQLGAPAEVIAPAGDANPPFRPG